MKTIAEMNPDLSSERGQRLVAPRVMEQNNFDALRLLFATFVLLAHASVMSQSPILDLPILGRADIAVEGFFVISGFLVFMSWEKTGSFWAYARRRLRRIYPAYFVVVVLCAVGLVALSDLPPGGYFSGETAKYLFHNLIFLNFLSPTLPGVFQTNPIPEVNPALWTLKIEVMFYAIVPALAWLMTKLNRLLVIAAIYLGAFVYGVVTTKLFEATGSAIYLQLSQQLPAFMGYFILGAGAYYYLPVVLRHKGKIALAGAVALIFFNGRHDFLTPVALTALIIPLGFGPYWGNAARFGDLSYGVYIYHSPVIQILVAVGLFGHSLGAGLATATATTFGLAYLSWTLVEKRWLSPQSHFRRAEAVTIESASPPTA